MGLQGTPMESWDMDDYDPDEQVAPLHPLSDIVTSPNSHVK